MPVQLLDENNQPVDVPEDQVAEGIASGKLGAPSADHPIPVKIADQLVSVPVSKLGDAIKNHGAVVASQQEFDAAQQAAREKKEYGGLGGTAEAFAAGVGTTAAFGAHHAFQTDEQKAGERAAVRQHPWANYAGQGLGVAVPVIADIASGGTATPEILAGEAAARGGTELAATQAARVLPELVAGADTGLSGVARLGAQAVAAPMRGVSAVGDLAGDVTEKALRSLVGPEATSVAGKLAERAAIGGAKYGTEGALLGAAQTAGDEMLNEHPDLSAEHLVHGALIGSLLGIGGAGVLGLGGELSSRYLGDTSRFLSRGAEDQAARAIGAEGDTALGRYALKSKIVEAGDTAEHMLPKAEAAAQDARDQLGKVLDEADFKAPNGPRVSTLIHQMDNQVERIAAPSLKKSLVNKIDGLKMDFLERAGVSPASVEAKAVNFESLGASPEVARFRAIQEAADKATLTFRDAHNLLGEIGQHKDLAEVTSLLDREIGRALKKTAPDLHDAYSSAVEDLSNANTIASKLGDKLSKQEAGSLFNPVTALAGHALGGLHGGPIGLAAGLASGVGKKALMARGQSTAAVVLDKLATTQALARVAAQQDRAIQRAVQSAVHGTDHPDHKPRVDIPKTYSGKVKSVIHAAQDPDQVLGKIQQVTGKYDQNHPAVSDASLTKSVGLMTFLAESIPKSEHPSTDSLTPQLDKPQTSQAEKDTYDLKYQAGVDPMGSISKLKSGTMTPIERDVIKTYYPQTYAKVTAQLKEELGRIKSPEKAPSYQVEQGLRMFLGLPAVSPPLASVMSANEAEAKAPMPKPSESPKGAPKRKIGDGLAKASKLP